MAALDHSLLDKTPAFEVLDRQARAEVIALARAMHYAKGATVFQQDAAAGSFFVLLSGHLQVARLTPAGQQVVLRYITPGDMFGIAVQMGRSVYPATATAVADSVALAWPSSVWPELMAKYPQLAAGAMRLMGTRLDDAHTRVVEMSTEEVERRVAHALLRLARQAGRKTEAGVEIDFPISRQDVAEMTGTTLHTVSRILSAWEGKGLVAGGRQRIVLLDPHRLFLLAEDRTA